MCRHCIKHTALTVETRLLEAIYLKPQMRKYFADAAVSQDQIGRDKKEHLSSATNFKQYDVCLPVTENF
jgi:hypothetical protein